MDTIFVALFIQMDALKRILELGDTKDILEYNERVKAYIVKTGLPHGLPDWVEEYLFLIETLVILEVRNEAHVAVCQILTYMKSIMLGPLVMQKRLMTMRNDVGDMDHLPKDVCFKIAGFL